MSIPFAGSSGRGAAAPVVSITTESTATKTPTQLGSGCCSLRLATVLRTTLPSTFRYGILPERSTGHQHHIPSIYPLHPNSLSSDPRTLTGPIRQPSQRPLATQRRQLPAREQLSAIRLRPDPRLLLARRQRASRIPQQDHRTVHSERALAYIGSHQPPAQTRLPTRASYRTGPPHSFVRRLFERAREERWGSVQALEEVEQ